MAYLDVAGFRSLSLMPGSYIDELERIYPGWLQSQLDAETARMNARLAKRYAAPFVAPYPSVVQGWLAKIVTWNAYLKRGENPTDQQTSEYKEQALDAIKELVEAANSNVGLFELALRGDGIENGITRGTPKGYSEQSPYVWQDGQSGDARTEDRARMGRSTP